MRYRCSLYSSKVAFSFDGFCMAMPCREIRQRGMTTSWYDVKKPVFLILGAERLDVVAVVVALPVAVIHLGLADVLIVRGVQCLANGSDYLSGASYSLGSVAAVSYTHLTLPTNREV